MSDDRTSRRGAGGDRVRARQLATAARDAYRTTGAGFAKQEADVEAWLAK